MDKKVEEENELLRYVLDKSKEDFEKVVRKYNDGQEKDIKNVNYYANVYCFWINTLTTKCKEKKIKTDKYNNLQAIKFVNNTTKHDPCIVSELGINAICFAKSGRINCGSGLDFHNMSFKPIAVWGMIDNNSSRNKSQKKYYEKMLVNKSIIDTLDDIQLEKEDLFNKFVQQ